MDRNSLQLGSDTRPLLAPFIYPPTPLGPTPCLRGQIFRKQSSEKRFLVQNLPRLLTSTKRMSHSTQFRPTWPRERSKTTTKQPTLPGTPRGRPPRRPCTSLSHPLQHHTPAVKINHSTAALHPARPPTTFPAHNPTRCTQRTTAISPPDTLSNISAAASATHPRSGAFDRGDAADRYGICPRSCIALYRVVHAAKVEG